MCLPNILFPVFMFAFIFHCRSCIFTLLAASIFHFTHRRFEVPCFSSYETPLFSITRSSSFSVFHVSVNIKNKRRKRHDSVVVFSF